VKIKIEFETNDGQRESSFDSVTLETWGADIDEHLANFVIDMAKVLTDVDPCKVAYMISTETAGDITDMEQLVEKLLEDIQSHERIRAQIESSTEKT